MEDRTSKQTAENIACKASEYALEAFREILVKVRIVLAHYEDYHDDYELSTSSQYGALLGAAEHASSAIELMEEKLGINQTNKIK